MTEARRWVAGPEHVGWRLDQVAAALTGLSRRRVRALLAAGEVAWNGKVTRSQSREITPGDVVDLLVEVAGTAPAPPPAITVLFEDRFLLAADKPAGVLSQPSEARDPGDMAFDERVLRALAHRDGQRPFLRLVHRIDRTTSGVLLFARAPEVLKPLTEIWQSGAAERRYLAVIDGVPERDVFTVEAPIARDPTAAWRFRVAPDGKPATTEVRVRHTGPDWALVECQLRSGRTHQVRVHLAHLGYPVRGDRLYGSVAEAPRPLLHAWRLTLPHPRTRQRVDIEAPPTMEFSTFGTS